MAAVRQQRSCRYHWCYVYVGQCLPIQLTSVPLTSVIRSVIVVCGSEVRHRAVLKVIEREGDAAAAAVNGSPQCLQSVYDVMSQSVPTDFVYNSPAAVNQIYNSHGSLHTDVRC